MGTIQMTRISIKDLELQVTRINKLTGSPLTSWERVDGKIKGNIGHYHLDQAYGGVKLVRMYNEGGGIDVISRNGYGTKRELYIWMEAFISGLQINIAEGQSQ